MDLYFHDDAHPDRPYHEVLRITADGDEAAVAEGMRISGWRKPESFKVRSIRSSSRNGDKLIYESAPDGDNAGAAIALGSVEPQPAEGGSR
jgi:hypothetical protein